MTGDWATEAAEKIWRENHLGVDFEQSVKAIAAALRAAEKRGMERAAVWHDLQEESHRVTATGLLKSEVDRSVIHSRIAGVHAGSAAAIRAASEKQQPLDSDSPSQTYIATRYRRQ